MSRSVAAPMRTHAATQKATAEPVRHKGAPSIVPVPSHQAIRLKSNADRPWKDRTARAAASVEHGGEPLPRDLRAYFEPRFGHDLSGVRLHRDRRAADMAELLNARAFTLSLIHI